MLGQGFLLGILALLGIALSYPRPNLNPGPPPLGNSSVSNTTSITVQGAETPILGNNSISSISSTSGASGTSHAPGSSSTSSSPSSSSTSSTSSTSGSSSASRTTISSASSTSGCTVPAATASGEIPMTFECKVCDESTNINGLGLGDVVSFWQAADANDALAESLRWYNLAKLGDADDDLPNDDTYIAGIQTLWKTNETMDCTMDDGSCQTLTCEQGEYPAAYLITNSFVNYRNLMKSQYDALQAAQENITNSMSVFSETFAPVVTDMSDQAIKLLIDGFASAYGLLSAFSWNKLLKDAPYFKQHSNDHGWAKDSSNTLVSNGASTAKDALSDATDTIANQNNLTIMAGQLATALANHMETQLLWIQNGTLSSNQVLNDTLYNGIFLAFDDVGISMEDMEDAALKVLYAQLLIPAWTLVADAADVSGYIHPVILNREQPGVCNDTNPFWGQDPQTMYGGDSSTPPPRDRARRSSFSRREDNWPMSNQDSDISRVCLPGSSSTYYLIASGYGNPTETLTHALPGADQLQPPDGFYGLTIDMIVNSSVMAYQLNGNANGYAQSDNPVVIDGQDDNTLLQDTWNSPGFFSIPICGSDEIVGAMINIDPSKNDCNGQWPCCGLDETAVSKGAVGNPPRKVKKTDESISDE